MLRERRKVGIPKRRLAVAREGIVNRVVVFILEFVFIYIVEVERSVGFQCHAHASTVDIVRRNSDLSNASVGSNVVTFS